MRPAGYPGPAIDTHYKAAFRGMSPGTAGTKPRPILAVRRFFYLMTQTHLYAGRKVVAMKSDFFLVTLATVAPANKFII
ncbi:hypothetical protein SAMN04487895_10175 [Paenibacillus sophorae]|uniref:Uncharacterized protein n=1 Tax=Paenibacillus sophorae TaxID=1333845 RepID=A0A1H8FET1_9BACL|nr:hypothetical protein SAMN04487895_10175 [Paenibacillus sophorae]